MKRFFKSLLISLCVGIPLAAGAIFFMYTTQKEAAFEPVEIHISEKEILPEDNMQEQRFVAEEEKETKDETQIPDKSSVTLSFAGDVHFSEQYIEAYEKNGVGVFADDEMRSQMLNSDLFILNHEFVFSLRGEAMADKEYTLRNDPKYVKILQELGVDVVSVANNHILDFGQEAFLDTLDTLEQAKIAYAGGGRDIQEASEPVVRTINGQTFALFAATRVSPSYDWYASSKRPGIFQTYDAKLLNEAISDAQAEYDHIIVFVHWGIERNEIPEEYQRTLAKGYIDAGADLIVGCHPHVLQGFEYYQGVPIIYSLGNYLFGNRTGETILLNAEFSSEGNLTIQLVPCERVDGILTKIQETEEIFDHLTELSFEVGISENGILVP